MSDGKVHSGNAFITMLAFLIIAFWAATIEWPLGVGIATGTIMGFFIDPDLDHRQTTHSEYRMYRLGKVFGVIFQMYWTPYQAIFHHGHPWTHGGPGLWGLIRMAIVATPIRILYALWWAGVGLIILSVKGYLHLGVGYAWWLLGLWVAWAVQDAIHWMRDFVFD